MGFHSQIINMVVVDSVLVSAKRLKLNTFASRNKINEYGIIKDTLSFIRVLLLEAFLPRKGMQAQAPPVFAPKCIL